MNESVSLPESEYDLLKSLDWSGFGSGSFLKWPTERVKNRWRFFEDTATVGEALVKLTEKYPEVYLVRGSGLDNPFGTGRDFFVGNIWSAFGYAEFDTMKQRRIDPVIVYGKLAKVLGLVADGQVLFGSEENHFTRLCADGVITFEERKDGLLSECFKVAKVPSSRKVPEKLWSLI